MIASADELYRNADLQGAKAKYESAWNSVTPDANNDSMTKMLVRQIRNYRILLGQLDQAFPPGNFPLVDFVKQNAADFGYSDDEVSAFK